VRVKVRISGSICGRDVGWGISRYGETTVSIRCRHEGRGRDVRSSLWTSAILNSSCVERKTEWAESADSPATFCFAGKRFCAAPQHKSDHLSVELRLFRLHLSLQCAAQFRVLRQLDHLSVELCVCCINLSRLCAPHKLDTIQEQIKLLVTCHTHTPDLQTHSQSIQRIQQQVHVFCQVMPAGQG